MADPLTHGGIPVIAHSARDRVEAQPVPAEAPVAIQIRVGATESRHGAQQLVPAALRFQAEAVGGPPPGRPVARLIRGGPRPGNLVLERAGFREDDRAVLTR